MLVINLSSELPLSDLPNIESIWKLIEQNSLEESGLRSLSYLAILSNFWEAGVGINSLSSDKMETAMKSVMLTLSSMTEENKNFSRFAAF